MNSIIAFISILIATLAIQTSKCVSVHGVHAVDSFFPLNSQSSNSRKSSERSHSSRSTSDSRNRDKKNDRIDFVGQGNPLNPTTYVKLGGSQQPTTLQDVSIKSVLTQGMTTGASNYGSTPMNIINPYANGAQTVVPLSSLTQQQVVPTTGQFYVSNPSVMTPQYPSGLMQNNGMGQHVNLVHPQSTFIQVPATVVHTPVYTTYTQSPYQQHILAH